MLIMRMHAFCRKWSTKYELMQRASLAFSVAGPVHHYTPDVGFYVTHMHIIFDSTVLGILHTKGLHFSALMLLVMISLDIQSFRLIIVMVIDFPSLITLYHWDINRYLRIHTH